MSTLEVTQMTTLVLSRHTLFLPASLTVWPEPRSVNVLLQNDLGRPSHLQPPSTPQSHITPPSQ